MYGGVRMPDRWKGRGEGKESRPANQAAFTTGGGEEGEASKWVPVGLINMSGKVLQASNFGLEGVLF